MRRSCGCQCLGKAGGCGLLIAEGGKEALPVGAVVGVLVGGEQAGGRGKTVDQEVLVGQPERAQDVIFARVGIGPSPDTGRYQLPEHDGGVGRVMPGLAVGQPLLTVVVGLRGEIEA